MSENLQPDGPMQPLYVPIKRRSFFMYAGATAGATALLLSGCDDDDDTTQTSMVNLTNDDFGILNYAYALEQLEAAFYTQVRSGSYYTSLAAGSAEKQIFDDLYYHEVIHREFFKKALGTNAIKDLTPTFGNIFGDRTQVLATAMAFEDLGVAAYNGAGQYITNPLYLHLAGKIVSVEARHAAIIRDLVREASFVDNDVITLSTVSNSAVATNNAPANSSLERAKSPSEVVAIANTFLAEGSKINASAIR